MGFPREEKVQTPRVPPLLDPVLTIVPPVLALDSFQHLPPPLPHTLPSNSPNATFPHSSSGPCLLQIQSRHGPVLPGLGLQGLPSGQHGSPEASPQAGSFRFAAWKKRGFLVGELEVVWGSHDS